MRGKKAKSIRKQVYGDYSPRFREYRLTKHKNTDKTFIIADERRRIYQALKQ